MCNSYCSLHNISPPVKHTIVTYLLKVNETRWRNLTSSLEREWGSVFGHCSPFIQRKQCAKLLFPVSQIASTGWRWMQVCMNVLLLCKCTPWDQIHNNIYFQYSVRYNYAYLSTGVNTGTMMKTSSPPVWSLFSIMRAGPHWWGRCTASSKEPQGDTWLRSSWLTTSVTKVVWTLFSFRHQILYIAYVCILCLALFKTKHRYRH